jgi:hypothetical protein
MSGRAKNLKFCCNVFFIHRALTILCYAGLLAAYVILNVAWKSGWCWEHTQVGGEPGQPSVLCLGALWMLQSAINLICIARSSLTVCDQDLFWSVSWFATSCPVFKFQIMCIFTSLFLNNHNIYMKDIMNYSFMHVVCPTNEIKKVGLQSQQGCKWK